MNAELERLLHRPKEGERPGGIGTVRFVARCPGGTANEVLAIAKHALEVAIRFTTAGTFDESAWTATLPKRFVGNSAQPRSQEEIDRESVLPIEERIRLQKEQRWSVRMFMNSFLPELGFRHWSWWDATVLDENHIGVAVQVKEWPFPWESLRWLFRASGADDIESAP